MVNFNSRDIAVIALCAAFWGVLNSIFSPLVFQIIRLPILCDLLGFTALTITVWWTRKPGATAIVGIIATAINFTLNPTGTQFLGFTAASILFDAATRLVGYDNIFKKPLNTILITVPISTVSAALAGYIIGTYFLVGPSLAQWGVLGWTMLHAIGGIMGGIMGASLVIALTSRGVLLGAQRIDPNRR